MRSLTQFGGWFKCLTSCAQEFKVDPSPMQHENVLPELCCASLRMANLPNSAAHMIMSYLVLQELCCTSQRMSNLPNSVAEMIMPYLTCTPSEEEWWIS